MRRAARIAACAGLASIAMMNGGCGSEDSQEEVVVESTPITASAPDEKAVRDYLASAIPDRIREQLQDPRWELVSEVDLKDAAAEVCRLTASDGPVAAQEYVRDKFQRLQGAENEFIRAATDVSCPGQ
ncbi:hypothetical protein [Rhodococcus opacus]|uniref:DUF732 domain-containing protein n=1 Tax=Rhodococcus opacus (strain B4) TaxID=632772 RepID=C1B817_RHOOB|nr:hypothetical protein [Rhodococcus opacus]BAH51820.1 hypothetical protein ROP_35730 [Rhodococcus opacus B4]